MELVRTACCGVKEIHGIKHEDPDSVIREALKAVVSESVRLNAAILTFTSNDGKEDGYGQRLKRRIEELELGEVGESSQTTNPNSGNMISLFYWILNKKCTRELWKEMHNQYVKDKIGTMKNFQPGTRVRVKDDCYDLCGDPFHGVATIDTVEHNNLVLKLDQEENNWCPPSWFFSVQDVDKLEIVK